MNIEALREGWDHAAKDDPMYHILSLQGKETGGWDRDEFFETGRKQVAEAMRYLTDYGVRHGAALDFGCGIGRLTEALADYFDYVLGFDLSPEMVRQARELSNQFNARYMWGSDLQGVSGGRDLIYSAITLQHMPPELQRGYVQDFIRLLSPVGIALFQLPEGQSTDGNDFRSMYGTPQATVAQWVREAGGRVLDVTLDAYSGGDWQDWRYAVVRR